LQFTDSLDLFSRGNIIGDVIPLDDLRCGKSNRITIFGDDLDAAVFAETAKLLQERGDEHAFILFRGCNFPGAGHNPPQAFYGGKRFELFHGEGDDRIVLDEL